ncbi:MAG: TonB-dependent receptor [Myxococcota bacterium]
MRANDRSAQPVARHRAVLAFTLWASAAPFTSAQDTEAEDEFTLDEPGELTLDDAGDIQLEGDLSEDMDDLMLRTVVVTGTRREQPLEDLPVAVEVITQEEIDRSGAETLAELLEERAGLQTFNAFRGQGVQLRGLEPEHTLILVDGERTIGRIDGTLDLTRWQLEDVERVEIARGSASALWGSDALAGVINIIPRRGQEGWTASARATYGYQDRRRSNRRSNFEGGPRIDDGEDLPDDSYGGTYDLVGRLGYGTQRAGGTVFLGYHRLDGFDLDPRDGATNAPDTETITAGLSGWAKFGPTTLRLRSEILHRDDVIFEARGPRLIRERLNRTDTANVSLTPVIDFDRGQLTMRVAYSRFRDQFLRRIVGEEQIDPTTITTEQLGQLQGRYVHSFNDAHVFTIGYDTSLETLRTPRLQRTGTRARLAPYVQHEWTVSEEPYVAVVPGIRLDADSWFGTAVSPKVAVRVDPHEKLVLRASGGRGFRAPDFRELLLQFTDNESLGYIVFGNPDLEPETSWSVDGGAELRLGRAWLGVTGYATYVDDLITVDLFEVDGAVSRFGYVNVGSARTRGLEAQARFAPLRGGDHRFRIDASYTFLDADDRTNNRPLPGRARHAGTLHLRYQHQPSGISALWRSRLSGERIFFDGDERIEAEPFLSLDLRLEKNFAGDRFRIFVGVDNVLNNGGTFLTTRPRTFWFGVAARRRAEEQE